MQEASVQGFVRTILIIVAIYYALKIIGRFAAPIIIKKAASKFEERVKNQQQPAEPKGKVGETTIDSKPGSSKASNDNVGEYVDYEEVDE